MDKTDCVFSSLHLPDEIVSFYFIRRNFKLLLYVLSYPRMIHDFIGLISLIGINDQQLFNQVLGLRADLLPILLRKVILTLFDFIVEYLV
jgi:hypothetical protein